MRPKPYGDAPRLPAGDPIDPGSLLEIPNLPIELEIGPGRGWFMIERLAAAPAIGMLGLEIRRKWVAIVEERLRRRGLHVRARVFAEDARLALPRFVSGTVSVIYLHFPDPWWKKRHGKRSVMTAALIREAARLLRPDGELFVQTDVAARAETCEALVREVGSLEPWGSRPQIEDNPYGARSPRERRVLQDGLPVYRLRYRRSHP
jgi:tRNA (guanine-N7-)-methyltransferase